MIHQHNVESHEACIESCLLGDGCEAVHADTKGNHVACSWLNSVTPSDCRQGEGSLYMRNLGELNEIRAQLARASLELIFDTSARAHQPLIDLKHFGICQAFEAAYQLLGVRGTIMLLVLTDPFMAIMERESRARGTPINAWSKHDHMNVYYESDAIPVEMHHYLMPGGMFWPRHWIGGYLAEKFLKEGALSLRGPHDPTPARLANDNAFMIEMVDATDRLGADFVTVSVLHATAWTILPHKMNNRNNYPTDIVNAWCRDKVWDDRDWGDDTGVDTAYECRHAMGHAMIYAAAQRKDNVKANACMQYRTDHHRFPKNAIDEAHRLCDSAPDGDLQWGCYSGADHSERIMKPCLDRDISNDEYYCSPAIVKAA